MNAADILGSDSRASRQWNLAIGPTHTHTYLVLRFDFSTSPNSQDSSDSSNLINKTKMLLSTKYYYLLIFYSTSILEILR